MRDNVTLADNLKGYVQLVVESSRTDMLDICCLSVRTGYGVNMFVLFVLEELWCFQCFVEER